MAPEGINQNYIMYDFMSEMTLNKSPVDTKKWIVQYSTRRYGINHKLLTDSWLILEASVYNAFPWSRSNAHTIISARPGLNRTESVSQFFLQGVEFLLINCQQILLLVPLYSIGTRCQM